MLETRPVRGIHGAIVSVLLVSLLGSLVSIAGPGPRRGIAHLVILHTNDMHGQALPLGRGNKARGGFAALARTIEKERAQARSIGCEPLLVDAGDMWVGPPEGSRTEGRFVATVMNELRYDVAAVGNHEFDHGPAKVAALAGWVKFPLLGANVKETATHKVPGWLKASTTFERSGVTIRFVGLLTSKIHEVTTPAATAGLDVEEEEGALADALAQEPRGDLTVLITHCGHEVDKHLATLFHGQVAAIVGGHTHRPLDPAWRVPQNARDPVLVTQTGAKTANLGRIDLDVDRRTGRVVRAASRLIPVRTEDEDPSVKKLVAAEVEECNKLLGVKVGSIATPLVRAPRSISNLGSLICDIMREAGRTDLAFTNPRGLRADIAAGDVLLRDIFEVDPFENTLMKMTFTGVELRLLLEEMCAVEPLESSGLELRYDSRKPKGARIIEVKVGGAPIDDARVYSVATNNFLAGGGDRYEHFRRGKDVQDTHEAVRDHVRRYFERLGLVPQPDFAKRIVNVAKEK